MTDTRREEYMAADPELYRGERVTSPLNPAAMLGEGSKPQMNERQKVALAGVVALLKQSGLSAEAQTAVALNAAVSLVRDVPGVAGKRGEVINAMTTEFRKRLQLYLPLPVAVGALPKKRAS